MELMRLNAQKKQLRDEIKKRRSSIPRKERAKKNLSIIKNLEKIDAFTHAKRIFCYISYAGEVDTRLLIERYIKTDVFLAVPRIIGKTEMIAVKLDNQDDLKPGQLGILTPDSDQAVSGGVDLCITPGLAFTEHGERLGYGRGYYDRWFSKNKVKTKLGIAFEEQIVSKLPTERTDILLDIIVTEDQIIDLRS